MRSIYFSNIPIWGLPLLSPPPSKRYQLSLVVKVCSIQCAVCSNMWCSINIHFLFTHISWCFYCTCINASLTFLSSADSFLWLCPQWSVYNNPPGSNRTDSWWSWPFSPWRSLCADPNSQRNEDRLWGRYGACKISKTFCFLQNWGENCNSSFVGIKAEMQNLKIRIASFQ